MKSSYILIDENGSFLDSSNGKKTSTKSILDVGVEDAANELLSSSGGGFNHIAYSRRNGNWFYNN